MKNENENGVSAFSHLAERPKKRHTERSRYNFSIFGLILVGIICYISICRINAYSARYGELRSNNSKNDMMEESIRRDPDIWNEVVRYAKNLDRFYIYHRNFNQIPDSEKVTQDDMAEDTAMLSENLNTGLAKAAEDYNKVMTNPDAGSRMKQDAETDFYNMVNKLLENYSYEMEAVKAAKLKDRISNYALVQTYLDTTKEFAYYITDNTLNRTFSNVVGTDISSYMETETYININLSELDDTFSGIPLNYDFEQNQIVGFIMIPVNQPSNSIIINALENAIYVKDNQIEVTRNDIVRYLAILLMAILAGVFTVTKSLLPDAAAAKSGFLLVFKGYLKLPVVAKLILAILALGAAVNEVIEEFYITGPFSSGIVTMFTDLLQLYMVVLVVVFTIMYLIHLFKNIGSLRNEYEYRFIVSAFRDFSVMIKFSPALIPLISLAGTSAVVFFACFALYASYRLYYGVTFMLTIIVCMGMCALLIALLKICATYTKLGYYITNIEKGNLLDVPEEGGWFARPLNSLNKLSEGLKVSLNEMLVSERTKTELITNVSHDLKTPLTSIINYVDLLQKCNLPDPATREYVEILKQKSSRLKVLIEDLFEASKLSSHSMKLSLEMVDVIQLLKQAVGELSEKFENAELDIRLASTSEKILVMLDGKRMWRVFENLLNNIVNYSPMGSRVYVAVTEDEKTVEITMKNISVFELDFDAAELFERFKRGDSARTTEGSGLGLSISKDIVELHGGKMDIVIDGDLFKVIICLNKVA